MSTRRRKNAGQGYGYMFSGAFKKKADAAKKEKTRKGSFVKFAMTNQGGRYLVMTPRTNPRKKKAKRANPTELLVMGANPEPTMGQHIQTHEHDQTITLPPGATVTIRMNPVSQISQVNPADRFTSVHAKASGISSRVRQKRAQTFSRGLAMGRRARRAGARGAVRFAEDFGRDVRARGLNPICGAQVQGEPCTRLPGHKGPHLPQGATMRPKSRLRKHWQPNPSAAALREKFTGMDVETVNVYNEPHMPGGDYAKLGDLDALFVKPLSGGQVQQIKTTQSARPVVVSDETARQIYFVGGDQDVSSALSVFGAQQRADGKWLIGEARTIDYQQRKEHAPQPEVDRWRHNFGEESGVHPKVLFDAVSKRLVLEGGEYRIESAGIIN